MDDRLIPRIDALLGVLWLWLVVACFALMALDVAVGVLAFGTVILTTGVALRSFRRARPARATPADPNAAGTEAAETDPATT